MIVTVAPPHSDTAAGRIIARYLAEFAPDKAAELVSVNARLVADPPRRKCWQITARHRNGRTFYLIRSAGYVTFATLAEYFAAILP